MILKNGAEALKSVSRKTVGVVLARWGDEYVVWNFYLDAEGQAITEHGNYFRLLNSADSNFKERAMRFMGW